jgi:muconolactone delta-isomerase
MALGLIEAMRAWVKRYTEAGKMELSWALAGRPGDGGGILNVDSHEELDRIMNEFPFQFVSTTQVQPLADLTASLDTSVQVIQAMAQGGR